MTNKMSKININRIIEYIVYAFAFFLPLQTRWIIKEGMLSGGAWEYGTYSLYFTDILLIFLFILVGGQFLKKETDFKKNDLIFKNKYFLIFFGIFLLASFFSIFVSTDKMLAGYIFLRILSGVFIFSVVSRFNFNKFYLLVSFITGAALQAILGIWQFLSQSSFANKWLGLALHDPWDLGVSVVETLQGERWLRAYGSLDHPNILGGLIVVSILILLSLVLQNSEFKIFNFHPFGYKQFSIFKQIPIFKSKTFQFFSFFIFYFLFLASLFFTFSRAAWVALVLGVVLLLELLFFSRKLFQPKGLFMILMSGGALIFILFNLYGNLASARLSGDSRLELKSYDERINALNDFEGLIRSNWLLGAGLGNYGLALYQMDPGKSVWRYQPVHIAFLLVWEEIGVLGFLGYLGLLGWLGYILIVRKNYFSVSILLSLIILMLGDHWLWSNHFGVLFFWFILGIILGLQAEQSKISAYLQNIKNKL
jgi:hypothetical protein